MNKASGIEAAFETLFRGLQRHAPGSEASTRRALRTVLPLLPVKPRALDLGCGGGPVCGVDLHRPFLSKLNSNEGGRVLPVQGDISLPPFEPKSFDLLWSEGAIYAVDVESGLDVWSELLRPGGCLGLTQLCWLAAEPPPEAQRFWAREYPAIDHVAALRAVAEKVGYEVLETFSLPRSDWEQEYYRPLRRRIAELAGLAREWEELRTALDAVSEEIRMFERHGDSYGYVFLVLRKL